MVAMKIKLSILLCIVSPFLKGGRLFEQLNSVQDQFYALPQNLTIEGVCSVLNQIDRLVNRSDDDVTEEEDGIIMELDEDGMFLKVLRDYMQNPSQDLAASLLEWLECKPGLYEFVQKVAEKYPGNGAFNNTNLGDYIIPGGTVPSEQ